MNIAYVFNMDKITKSHVDILTSDFFDKLKKQNEDNIKDFMEKLPIKIQNDIFDKMCANVQSNEFIDYTKNIDSHIGYGLNGYALTESCFNCNSTFEKIKNKLNLELGEYIILVNGHMSKLRPRTNSSGCITPGIYVFEMIVVTNFSKLYHSIEYNHPFVNQNETFYTAKNIKLNNIFVNIIQLFKNITGISATPLVHENAMLSKIGINVRNIIIELFELNEKYFYKFLSTTEINEKYEQSLINIQNKDKEINELNNKIKSLENKIKNAVPIENQCCICFGFTNKRKLLVPCGHTQFCDDCITKINKCSLCNKDIEQVVNIFD